MECLHGCNHVLGTESSEVWQMNKVELHETAVMRWTLCVLSCTRSEGLLLDHD